MYLAVDLQLINKTEFQKKRKNREKNKKQNRKQSREQNNLKLFKDKNVCFLDEENKKLNLLIRIKYLEQTKEI